MALTVVRKNPHSLLEMEKSKTDGHQAVLNEGEENELVSLPSFSCFPKVGKGSLQVQERRDCGSSRAGSGPGTVWFW